MTRGTDGGDRVTGLNDNVILSRSEARETASTSGDARILVGDVRAMLRTLPAESVHCVVTSPPYFSLRSYSTNPQLWSGDPACEHSWLDPVTVPGITGGTNQGGKTDNPNGVTYRPVPPSSSSLCRHCGAWRGELGGEPTPELYVEHIVEVFREVRRVLRKDGTCWINLGDSYAASSHGPGGAGKQYTNQGSVSVKGFNTPIPAGLKPKDLVGIPWRVAFALQADGWWLRQDIIWNKPAAMPESVQDRMTKSHEYVFLLAKSPRYYFDPVAIAEPASSDPITVARNGRADKGIVGARDLHGTDYGQSGNGGFDRSGIATRNKRSVWTINTEPTSINHFATYPEKLVEPCILAGTSEKGVCSAPITKLRVRSDLTAEEQAKVAAFLAKKGLA